MKLFCVFTPLIFIIFLTTALRSFSGHKIHSLKCVLHYFLLSSELCNCHHYLVPEHFLTPRRNPILISSYSQPPTPRLPVIHFLSRWICLFQTFRIKGLIQFSFSIIFSRFIYIVARSVLDSFIWLNNTQLYGYTTICLTPFTHWWTLGCNCGKIESQSVK